MKLLRTQPLWGIGSLALFSLMVSAQPGQNFTGCQFTSWYSEEHGYWFEKLDGYPMTGLMCQGRFCDDIRAKQCTHFTEGNRKVDLKVVAPTCDEPVLPFNQEVLGKGQCPDGQYVESMKCDGHFCDFIVLKCCRPHEWTVQSDHSLDTAWFGSGGGEVCPIGHVVIGARCKGWFCSEIQLICAPIRLHALPVFPTTGRPV